jgi:hypothetical protein
VNNNQYNLKEYPHKFFYRNLNLNLEQVRNILKSEYKRIEAGEMHGVKKMDNKNPENEIFKESKSLSTIKSREYNAFQMYYPFISEIYSSVFDMVLEACKYYNLDYNSEQWICQSWFNINKKENGGKLDYHDHISNSDKGKYLAFHGYYCVNAETSTTTYHIDGNTDKSNQNKNNQALLSAVGFPHAMEDWDWDEDRITLAYDVVPLRYYKQSNYLNNPNIKKHEGFWEQHWFPLPKISGNFL